MPTPIYLNSHRDVMKCLMKCLLVGVCMCTSGYAAEPEIFNAGSGTLDATTVLRGSPCHLVMRSSFQDIEMGGMALAQLQEPGDTGMPVKIHFDLRECGSLEGDTAGAMMVRFLSPAAPEAPKLFAIQGITGLALKLEDRLGRQIIPGESRKPIFSNKGYQLIYTVTPVRMPGPLYTGNFSASVDFGMSYE